MLLSSDKSTCPIVGRNVPMDGSQLDGIAADPELFNELPMNFKRQVSLSSCAT